MSPLLLLAAALGASVDARTFTVSCSSPLGPMRSRETYALAANEEPAREGDVVHYRIDVPPPLFVPPVPTHFLAATMIFQVPTGLEVLSARPVQDRTADYSQVAANVEGSAIVVELHGDFKLDGRSRPVPPVEVEARVVATPGEVISWMPPEPIEGLARAPLVGEQNSRCRVVDPEPIGETHVVAH